MFLYYIHQNILQEAWLPWLPLAPTLVNKYWLRPSGWAFGHYVLGFVQGLPETARNCPKLFLQIYIVKTLFSIKIN